MPYRRLNGNAGSGGSVIHDTTWPRLKDVVRFPIATFLQHTSKDFAFPPQHVLLLLSVMSRFWSGVFDVLPLLPPPRGEVRGSNSLGLFLKARQWHYTVFTIGMLDIPSMGTVVFPGSHSLACTRLVAASRQAGYLT